MNKKKSPQAQFDAETPQVFAVDMKDGAAKFTRRDFLKAAGMATSAAALACGSLTPTPTPIPTPTITPASLYPALGARESEACHELRSHTDSILALAISPNGTLISGSRDGTIKVWSLPGGTLLKTVQGTGESDVFAVSPDGRFAVVGTYDVLIQKSTLKVWSLPEGNLLKTLEGKKDFPNAAPAISRDGSMLASGMYETIELWSLLDEILLKNLETQSSYINALAFSPDGSLLISGSDNLQLWSLPEGVLVKTLAANSVYSLAVSADGNLLASGQGEGTIMLWSLPGGDLLKTLEGHPSTVSSLVVSPDGKMLVSSDGQSIKMWSLPEGSLLKSLQRGSGPLAISPDGSLLASGSVSSPTIRLWALPGGEMFACPFDLAASPEEAQGAVYQLADATGEVTEASLPCGAPLPPGAVCTCNCVAGGYVPSGGEGAGGSHYWYPN